MDNQADVRYPEVTVRLTGLDDSNFYQIIITVVRALRLADVNPVEIKQEFMADATSDDYDHLLQTVMKWVNVE